MEVKVGNVVCDVTISTVTMVTCVLGFNTPGMHDVVVTVTGVGVAMRVDGFEFLMTVDAITPDEGE